jgi:hypothetical protein
MDIEFLLVMLVETQSVLMFVFIFQNLALLESIDAMVMRQPPLQLWMLHTTNWFP